MKESKHISYNEVDRKLPFTVPDNYFEQFAHAMDQQIAVRRVSVYQIIKPWLYAAAVAVLVLFAGRAGYNVYHSSKISNSENYEMYVMSQIDETEMIDYYLTESGKQ